MNNPFEVLGLKGWADQEEIRAAYRTLVKQCHPDMIQNPLLKEEAQERMVRLNLAYEEALRLASPRPQAPAGPETTVAEAVLMAERSLARDNPEAALREAVRRSPENNVYRSGALAAVVAQREAETIQGKVKKVLKGLRRK